MRIATILLLLALLATAVWLLFFYEEKKGEGKALDTPTTGHILIMAEESYQPIIDSQIEVFHSMYQQAKIEVRYGNEIETLRALMSDSVSVAILSRSLSEKELVPFQNRQFTPKSTAIAKDGLALIIHPSNRDSTVSVEQVKQMLSGEISNWKRINPASKLGNIQIVFDNPNSGMVRYAVDSLCRAGKLPANASAVNGSREVIDYVSKNPNALGLIGTNWISDMDDSKVQKFLSNIRVMGVRKLPGQEAFTPHQAYLATRQYPFSRTMTVINAQARAGLGLGLASFMASDRGQRIVLKSGLLPISAPIRLVEIKEQ